MQRVERTQQERFFKILSNILVTLLWLCAGSFVISLMVIGKVLMLQ